MATRPQRRKYQNMARTRRKARSAAHAQKRVPNTYGSRNTVSRPCGCRKTGKSCPACGHTMRGPFGEGDQHADYHVWYCAKCGHRCERFAWEVGGETTTDMLALARRLYR